MAHIVLKLEILLTQLPKRWVTGEGHHPALPWLPSQQLLGAQVRHGPLIAPAVAAAAVALRAAAFLWLLPLLTFVLVLPVFLFLGKKI